ncbi:Hypothetical predicted protein [Olea europaea subsp. europaea]|uniref:Uncharacterized protein n=1 Tax=Olea europaea subsp. europaea TaxID=158383 RepID=A0A8S0UY34_OLEEU|nr:Hypothetical predicted protein [Olea europaea subsp. europaea]
MANPGTVRSTQVGEPHGLALSPPGAPCTVMGQAQFPPKINELVAAIRAVCENFGTKDFVGPMLLQIINSNVKSSISDGKAIGNHPIVPINTSNPELISTQAYVRDEESLDLIKASAIVLAPNSTNTPRIDFNQAYVRDEESLDLIKASAIVLAPNSTNTTVIKGHMRMGNNPIDRNEEQLTPNFNPQVMVIEPPSNPNSDNLVVTYGKAPPPLNSTTYNAPSEHVPPINSLANLTGNFEPPPQLKFKTNFAASSHIDIP